MIRQIEISVFLYSCHTVGHKIGVMFGITASALAAFQLSELSQFLHVWPIQKEHIVVQYNLALRDLPLFEQATLHP